MSKNNGGPAFPIHPGAAMDGQPIRETQGMTLRDYFAAKVMQGPVASDTFMSQIDTTAVDAKVPMDELMARAAYAIADAMLKERSK